MQFIKPDVNIDFLGKFKIAAILSLAMILVGVVSLIVHGGPNLGVDFAGGSVIQIKFKAPTSADRIKDGMSALGIDGTVQEFGDKTANEYLLRTGSTEISETEGYSDKLAAALKKATGQDLEIRRVETVGPQVGKDLREKALLAIFYALLFITIYISYRFESKLLISGLMAAAMAGMIYLAAFFTHNMVGLIIVALVLSLILFFVLELKYAMGAIVALIHDVSITVGIFSLFGKEFSLPIIAALLTIIGYSLNDTIIVFDRIRENLKKMHKNTLQTIINRSVNETLSRTILTSGTTLIVVIFLFVLGGDIIHDFAFAMLVGILVGTYSSIYVASPILLLWRSREKKAG